MRENIKNLHPVFENRKTYIRDAILDDVETLKKSDFSKKHISEYVGIENLEMEFKTSIYSLVTINEIGKIEAFSIFKNTPNINALLDECWINWLYSHFGIKNATYENTTFLTYFYGEDLYDTNMMKNILCEIFLREPKLKFIFAVVPLINSKYEEVLKVHCKQIFPMNEGANKSIHSIFICDKYDFIPKMRFRRALVQDNDDLVQIIDEEVKDIRLELGDFYIAEQVLQNDPSETIIVAEISNATIGMIWINANINVEFLSEYFEITAFDHFLRTEKDDKIPNLKDNMNEELNKINKMEQRSTIDLWRHSEVPPASLNNLYVSSSSSKTSIELENEFPKDIFNEWFQIEKTFKYPKFHSEQFPKQCSMPKMNEKLNAFAIQLFGLSRSIDPRRIFELIASSFASEPDRDYCIISVPSTEFSSNSAIGYLLQYFFRIKPRQGSNISESLYVAHRSSFHAEIKVEDLIQSDINVVENLLCHNGFEGKDTSAGADVINFLKKHLLNPLPTYDVYMFRCCGCTIGFSVLRQNCLMGEFRTHFVLNDDDEEVPDWKSGELLYFYLHPAFMWEWVFVAREIFRLTGYSSIYYRLNKETQLIPNSILTKMAPFLPRRRLDTLPIEPYALYHINIKMCQTLRVRPEKKLIIIGFDETCKGFLRTFLFSPKSKNIYNYNITVVVESFNFTDYDSLSLKKDHSMFFEDGSQFDAEYLRKLNFETWVDFVEGKVSIIKSEEILLENGRILHYDQLFLMCSSRSGTLKSSKTIPLNYLEINSRLDKIMLYEKIRLLVEKVAENSHPILIYGKGIIAHSCLSLLIYLGIKPSSICLIIPPKDEEETSFPETFDDVELAERIIMKEEDLGVKVYKNMKFIDWKLYEDFDAIENAIFSFNNEIRSFKCFALITFFGETLSEEMQKTLESQNITIRNNKIVIDQYSKTSLPKVYAFGKITQYEENLFANDKEQKYFNQSEIGKKVAMNLIKREDEDDVSLIKTNFVKCIFRQYQLVDDWVYAGFKKPGSHIPLEMRKTLQEYGYDLITNENNFEYCRVHFDINGFLTEIECLSKKHTNLEFLYRIFNLHVSTFNKLHDKYKRGEIKNLVDYFKEPIFSVLLHDCFSSIRLTMRNRNLDCLKDFLVDHKQIEKSEIMQHLQCGKMNTKIENDIINFIMKHRESINLFDALFDDFPN